MLSAARQDNFRIVRSQPLGLVVDADTLLGGEDDEETYPCSCNSDDTQPHCLLVLPMVRTAAAALAS